MRRRLYYIDNLRIFAVALVVLHHFATIYGATGDWYYVEGVPDHVLQQFLLTLFTATNQSFFMGLLFFVSAYFVRSSHDRKGGAVFLKDRLIRLGIPMVAFYFVLSPITGFIAYRMSSNDSPPRSFGEYMMAGWGRGLGPMWFVEVLIVFSLVYVLLRKWRGAASGPAVRKPAPSLATLIFVIAALGITTGLVRTMFSVKDWLLVAHLQLAHFPQYVLALWAGVAASKHQWLEALTARLGWRWMLFAMGTIVIGFPTIFILGGAASGNLEPFLGGWHWQSFVYAMYEQIVGVSLILGFLGIFKGHCNVTGKWVSRLSDASYTVYVFHPIIILLVAWAAAPWQANLLLKFTMLSLPCLVITFALGWLIRRIPLVSRIL